jgi:hypothetical protein
MMPPSLIFVVEELPSLLSLVITASEFLSLFVSQNEDAPIGGNAIRPDELVASLFVSPPSNSLLESSKVAADLPVVRMLLMMIPRR